MIIGDSQGAMYGYELASLARQIGFRLNILSVADGNELPEEPNTLWLNVAGFLDNAKPDVVIIAQAWWPKLRDHGQGHLGEAISSLVNRAAQIIVITQPPAPPPDATRHAILAGKRPPFYEDAIAKQSRIRANAIIREYESPNVQILDVADLFLDKDNSIKLIGPDGRLMFQDDFHLSNSGTAIVRPRLERALRNVLPPALHP